MAWAVVRRRWIDFLVFAATVLLVTALSAAAAASWGSGERAWDAVGRAVSAPQIWIDGGPTQLRDIAALTAAAGATPTVTSMSVPGVVSTSSIEQVPVHVTHNSDGGVCATVAGSFPRQGSVDQMAVESGLAAELDVTVGDSVRYWFANPDDPTGPAAFQEAAVVGICSIQVSIAYPFVSNGTVFVGTRPDGPPGQALLGWDAEDEPQVFVALNEIEGGLGSIEYHRRADVRRDLRLIQSAPGLLTAASAALTLVFAFLYALWALRQIVESERPLIADLRVLGWGPADLVSLIGMAVLFVLVPASVAGGGLGLWLANRLTESSAAIYGVAESPIDLAPFASAAVVIIIVVATVSAGLALQRIIRRESVAGGTTGQGVATSWCPARAVGSVALATAYLTARRRSLLPMLLVVAAAATVMGSSIKLVQIIERYTTDPTAWGILYDYRLSGDGIGDQRSDGASPSAAGMSRSTTFDALLVDRSASVQVELFVLERPGFYELELLAGRRAESPGEITVSNLAARSLALSVGDELTMVVESGTFPVKVVGLTRSLDSLYSASTYESLVDVNADSGRDHSTLLRLGDDGNDQGALADAAASGLSVMSAQQLISIPFAGGLVRNLTLLSIASATLSVIVLCETGLTIGRRMRRSRAIITLVGGRRRFVPSWLFWVCFPVIPFVALVGCLIGFRVIDVYQQYFGDDFGDFAVDIAVTTELVIVMVVVAVAFLAAFGAGAIGLGRADGEDLAT